MLTAGSDNHRLVNWAEIMNNELGIALDVEIQDSRMENPFLFFGQFVVGETALE